MTVRWVATSCSPVRDHGAQFSIPWFFSVFSVISAVNNGSVCRVTMPWGSRQTGGGGIGVHLINRVPMGIVVLRWEWNKSVELTNEDVLDFCLFSRGGVRLYGPARGLRYHLRAAAAFRG